MSLRKNMAKISKRKRKIKIRQRKKKHQKLLKLKEKYLSAKGKETREKIIEKIIYMSPQMNVKEYLGLKK